MYNAFFSGTFDVAEFITEAFVIFFIGLILYLRREDRREGYPLEDDISGRLAPGGSLFFVATPKTFILPLDKGTVTVPNDRRDSPDLKARRTAVADGSPLEPTGDPLLAGIGPGSYAQRAKRPDLLRHGGTKIAPLRLCPGFSLDARDPKVIGAKVTGADGAVAGTVVDAWIDRTEFLIRYLEIELPGSGRRVLAPMPLALVRRAKGDIHIDALLASQFANVPALGNPDQITLDEEERVAAYFGGGLLYATPDRTEPYL